MSKNFLKHFLGKTTVCAFFLNRTASKRQLFSVISSHTWLKKIIVLFQYANYQEKRKIKNNLFHDIIAAPQANMHICSFQTELILAENNFQNVLNTPITNNEKYNSNYSCRKKYIWHNLLLFQ